MEFPCMWGGKVIDSMFRLCQYTGYSRDIEGRYNDFITLANEASLYFKQSGNLS